MRRLIGLGCVALAALSPGLRADDKADEWKALKGAWKVEKAVLRGQDTTDAFKTAVLSLTDDGKYVVDFGSMLDKGKVEVDPAKKPKQMTITGTEGPSQGKSLPAIYELSGDTLKICYQLEGKDPPAALESKAGTATLFIEYKREKR
jgi:uncharacterized protein (TIGR03067 family)